MKRNVWNKLYNQLYVILQWFLYLNGTIIALPDHVYIYPKQKQLCSIHFNQNKQRERISMRTMKKNKFDFVIIRHIIHYKQF